MIRAILNDQKTVTRRVLKKQPPPESMHQIELDWLDGGVESQNRKYGYSDGKDQHASPYGGPGDTLRVRETWAVGSEYDKVLPRNIPHCHVRYAATDDTTGLKIRTPIHMPNWMCRIKLAVTSVRVERLNDMTESGAIDEGFASGQPTGNRNEVRFAAGRQPELSDPASAVGAYRKLWDSLNVKRGFPWASNPWVWVIYFRTIRDEDADKTSRKRRRK